MSVSDRLTMLPVSESGPPERGDAARNRALLLDAARRLVDERGAEAVTTEDIAAAAGVGKGTLFRRFGSRAGLMVVLLDEDEIDAVRIESKRTLELVQFVDACEIDPLYFEKPYYVAPQDELAEEAFIVLREALRKAKKVALGQLSVRGSEKLVAVKPCGKGLLLETLRYADEVRAGQAFFDEIDDAKPKNNVEMAETLN